jgi:hypothetical protein
MRRLVIINKKPVLNAAKKEVDIQGEISKGRTKAEIADMLDDNDLDDDGVDDQFAVKLVKSKCCCNIDEITGFIFAGFSSRFWMLRKHINSMDRLKIDKLPFFNWECISIEIKNRKIDLVIQDIHHMNLLLKFLIYHLETIDGKRYSARPIVAG